MKRVSIMLLSFLYSWLGIGQTTPKNTNTGYTYPTANGVWHFVRHSTKVLKCVYTPANYTRNEYLGDAVFTTKMAADSLVVVQDGNNTKLVWDEFSVELKNNTATLSTGLKITPVADNDMNGFQFSLAKDEQIFGGGSRALPLNRRGYQFLLNNAPRYGYENGAENLNYSVPFFTSSLGYGLLFDNGSKGMVDIGKTKHNTFTYLAASGEINCYIILETSPKNVLHKYHQLTGTQPLLPKWAWGNFMSRFGYVSDTQVREIAKGMEDAGIPYDAIIYDLFWFGDSIQRTLGNLDWVNKTAWPNPAKLIQDFKKKNIQSILITEPFSLKNTRSFASFQPYLAKDNNGNPYALKDFYFGEGGLIDMFYKPAQDHFFSYYQKQNKLGVAGWWGDLGEPENHPDDGYHTLSHLPYTRKFAGYEVHNLYGHTWTKMLFEQYAKHYPYTRLFSLNRSGFAGTQRYGIIPWTGDVSRSWAGLQAQLPILLGMSMSGIPYIHSDAGGFAGGNGDKELYIRWLQLAAYTPIFRPHGTALFEKDPNAFSYPSEPHLIGEPYTAIAKNIVLNRYRMLPYNYTLGYLQTTQGEPLMSPLYHHHFFDRQAAQVQDAYLWGKDILVAPVTTANTYQRSVYLPQGKWYTSQGKMLVGGRTYTEDVPLDQTAIFYRAGAIIPMIPAERSIKTTQDCHYKTLDVHVYVDEKNTHAFHLYNDDGVQKNSLTTRMYNLLELKVAPKHGNLVFSVQPLHKALPDNVEKITWHVHGVSLDKPLVAKQQQASLKVNHTLKNTIVVETNLKNNVVQWQLVDYLRNLRFDDTRMQPK